MSSGIDNSPRVDPDEIIAGIRKWVEIETPSPAGTAVNMLVDEVAVHGAQLGGHVNRRAGRDGYGDLLTVRSPWGGDGPGILVLSHLDTVHRCRLHSCLCPTKRLVVRRRALKSKQQR